MSELVTVAIASYNNVLYVDRCIESVIHQTYSNLEILIIDDGSKDGSLEIISKFKSDKRVFVIIKENGGLSSARQRALDEAKGVFISFIDADDYLANSYVENHINNLVNTNADISVCSTRFELANGDYLPLESKRFACDYSHEALRLKSDLLNRGTYPYNITLSDSWNKMYRMSFLRKTGVKFVLPKGLNGTDTAFNWKLALFEPTYSTIKNEDYIHVIYKSSAVHRKRKDLYNSFLIITRQLKETIAENKTTGLYNRAIASFYYGGLRMAVTDVARESRTLRECREGLSSIIKKHKGSSEEKLISLIYENKLDLDYRIIILLLHRAPCILAYYLFLRTHLADFIKQNK